MRQTPNCFGGKNVLEVLYHRAKFGGARISPATGVAKNVEIFVYLFVCLFVCPSRFWLAYQIIVLLMWYKGLNKPKYPYA